MLIVSQEKDIIINFDNVEMLGLNPDYKKEIFCTFNDGAEEIGTYNAEERAKEVLQEIIAVHQASKMFMATKGVLTQEEMCKAMIEQGKSIFKYEMPKE